MSKIINENARKSFLIKFGKHVKELREERGLTQYEFAKRCYSNVKKIGRTERGEYDFKFSSLFVLAKGLEITLPELIDFDFPENFFESFWEEEKFFEKTLS